VPQRGHQDSPFSYVLGLRQTAATSEVLPFVPSPPALVDKKEPGQKSDLFASPRQVTQPSKVRNICCPKKICESSTPLSMNILIYERHARFLSRDIESSFHTLSSPTPTFRDLL